MKTVQNYIKELDRDMLIEDYMEHIIIESYELKAVQDYTIRELRDRAKARVEEYIDRLVHMDITPRTDGRVGIVFACEVYENPRWDTHVSAALVHKDEVIDKGADANKYGFLLTPQSEIMGYYVADNKYTQDNIYELIVQIMHEASFFGYEQEDLQEVLNKLEKGMEQAEKGECVEARTAFKELREELGLPIPEEDEIQDDLRGEILKAIFEYDKYNFQRELLRIKEQLEKEN